MKILKKVTCTLAIVLAGVFTTQAQTASKTKKTAKETAVKNMIENRSYTFTAQSTSPLRGSTRQLTGGEYDLRIVKDSVIAYLPFFGRAYTATLNPDDSGFKFTSTKFSYTSTPKKNGYDIVIKLTDTKEAKQLTLSVSTSGYATLSIISLNRDPISFYGTVEANKKAK